jgi:hypothetical protein
MSKIEEILSQKVSKAEVVKSSFLNVEAELSSLGLTLIPYPHQNIVWSNEAAKNFVTEIKKLVNKTETGDGKKIVIWLDAEGFVLDYFYHSLTAAKDFALQLKKAFPQMSLEAKQVKISSAQACLRISMNFNQKGHN